MAWYFGRMPMPALSTPGSEELGSLGIRHVKRLWTRCRTESGGRATGDKGADWVADNTLLSGLRVGLRETYYYLYAQRPTLEQFEGWILEKNGGAIGAGRIAYLNAALSGEAGTAAPIDQSDSEFCDTPFSHADLAFWEENGYVVLHDAVPPANCEAAARAIYDFTAVDPEQPDTWYQGPQGASIWVPLLHHPALWSNRDSPRIHRAFAQLWSRSDLWVSVDQAGFNPPERPGWRFPGPHLHFDVSLALPIPFGVQGILYLTDTQANQGAFTCVPGFHRRVAQWLNSLSPNADPRTEDLTKLPAIPIPGRAGDLVIWHHALPHGASPNLSSRPRVVQYIKMQPSQWEVASHWR